VLLFSQGSADTELSDADLASALVSALEQLGERKKVITVPPDFTRFNSKSGVLACAAAEYYGENLADVLPALGTHFPMSAAQLKRMYPTVPRELIRAHRWREDVVTIGEVPADYVSEVTDGIWTRPWPAQLNNLIWEGGHDLILSIGQAVPHEVVGVANGNKNLFVGTGGQDGINESHYIGAVYGMERMMGRADTCLRRILNYAEDHFCQHLPIIYAQTVIGANDRGELVTRGLFVGDREAFESAAELAVEVNFIQLDEDLSKVVVRMDPDEFHSTWIGNKGIYRTRMAIADEGELIILAPGVRTFGEDPEIDVLIRKYGYRTTEEVMRMVDENEDLRNNLSAAAHLIHGSSEGRFKITYCPGHLTRQQIEEVGYSYADLDEMVARYDPENRSDGWNTTANGERFYYISNPAMGLWASKSRLQ
jgi:nickel-dependent lactate racemase